MPRDLTGKHFARAQDLGAAKSAQAIEIFEDNEQCVTVAKDESGAEYFRLHVPTRGTAKKFNVRSFLYSVFEGALIRAQTSFEGDFAVTKSPGRLFSKGSGQGPLTLGGGAFAEKLRALDLDPQPFETRYTPSMNAAFDWPVGR